MGDRGWPKMAFSCLAAQWGFVLLHAHASSTCIHFKSHLNPRASALQVSSRHVPSSPSLRQMSPCLSNPEISLHSFTSCPAARINSRTGTMLAPLAWRGHRVRPWKGAGHERGTDDSMVDSSGCLSDHSRLAGKRPGRGQTAQGRME